MSATNIKKILTNTVTANSGSYTIDYSGLTQTQATYFLNIYSPSFTTFIVPASSGDSVSGVPVISGSAIQDGPYYPTNFPDLYLAGSGSLYLTFTQVVSEGNN